MGNGLANKIGELVFIDCHERQRHETECNTNHLREREFFLEYEEAEKRYKNITHEVPYQIHHSEIRVFETHEENERSDTVE